MSESQPSRRARLPEGAARPRCDKCQAFMDIAPMIPGLGEFADRIFECSKCANVQVLPA